MNRSVWFSAVLMMQLYAVQSAQADAGSKIFSQAKEAFANRQFNRAAALCWQYVSTQQPAAEKYESAQFFLAASLQQLGFSHGAVTFYHEVANNRRAPELLPRALRALEQLSISAPIDTQLVLQDLIGDTDFGELPDDVANFVHYWQGLSNLRRGLSDWATERFSRLEPRGYYYFSALYATSVQLLAVRTTGEKEAALNSFATLFSVFDLSSALDALRRRGEGDSKLTYTLKAMLNEDATEVQLDLPKFPEGWEVELSMLGLARVAAETGALLARAAISDEEVLGQPFSYSVQIGGMPIYQRAPLFETRALAIKSVAAQQNAVRKIQGQALHSLARLLYEQKRYSAAYDTLRQIPPGTELGSEILLERAWAKFQAGDSHRAMGLLYALDAPVYRSLFAPEKYILRGLIYRRFCHFRAAKVAARRFRQSYESMLEGLRSGKNPASLEVIKQAAMAKGETRRLAVLLKTLQRELATVASQQEAWGGRNGLSDQLKQRYELAIRQTEANLNVSLYQSARAVAEQMLETEEQANLLEYEVGQAIFQRVEETKGAAKGRKTAAKIPASSERVYYKFSGEYWTDELPAYKFNIEDRCIE